MSFIILVTMAIAIGMAWVAIATPPIFQVARVASLSH